MQEKSRNIKAVGVDNTFLTAFLESMMLLGHPIFDMGYLNNVNVTIGLFYVTFYSREILLNRTESIRSECPPDSSDTQRSCWGQSIGQSYPGAQ